MSRAAAEVAATGAELVVEVPPVRIRAGRMASAFESSVRPDFERWLEEGRPPLAEFFAKGEC